jgi:hypothetical protein
MHKRKGIALAMLNLTFENIPMVMCLIGIDTSESAWIGVWLDNTAE